MNASALIRKRILHLEAKLDTTLFGIYRGDDGKFYREDGTEASAGDFKSVVGAAKAVGTVGAGVGALAGGRALIKRYGANQVTSPRKAVQAVARGIGRDVSGAARTAARGALNPAASIMDNLATRAGRISAVAADSAKKNRGIRKTLGLLGRAATRFETVKTRVIELAEN